MAPFVFGYFAGMLLYVTVGVGILLDARWADRSAARFLVSIPFWPVASVAALIWGSWWAARGYVRLVRQAELIPRRGPKEIGAGQLSVTDGAGGEVSVRD